MIEVSICSTFNYFREKWEIEVSQEFESDLHSQIDDKLVTIQKNLITAIYITKIPYKNKPD